MDQLKATSHVATKRKSQQPDSHTNILLIPAKRYSTTNESCVSEGQDKLLLAYEKNVRTSCNITLSSEPIISVPRITNIRLDPIVQSNIARLQNAQRPIIKAENKRLALVVRELSKISTGAINANQESHIGNPFKRVASKLVSTGRDLFAPQPPIRSTITYEQYKQGIRSNYESTGIETKISESLPSDEVSIDDLNIETDSLYADILTGLNKETDAEVHSLTSIPIPDIRTRTPLSPDNQLVPRASPFNPPLLPDKLFDSDYGCSSPELEIGLDTEDELLRSDTDESLPVIRSLIVKIDVTRINLNFGSRATKSQNSGEGSQVRNNQWSKYQRYPFDDYHPGENDLNDIVKGNARNRKNRVSPPRCLPLLYNRRADDNLPDTDTEDKNCPTPKHPCLEPYLTQCPSKSADSKWLNKRMKRDADATIAAHRIIANTRDKENPSSIRPALRSRLGPAIVCID